MARSLTYVPTGGGSFLVTTRTVHGRFLLKPGVRFNALAAGVLGKAQCKYQVEIHGAVVLSNHYHLLLTLEDAQQLSSFMRFFNSNLAREAGRLYGWKEKIWGRRYRSTLISQEPEALIERLRYVLAQGCKEGLVGSPLDWPGLTCVHALLEGQPIEGIWVNRSRHFRARLRGKDPGEGEFEERETVTFSPLPCWKELTTQEHRARIRELVEGIVDETTKAHQRQGTQPLGPKAIRRQQPHHHPDRPARSPAPRFHAATRAVRQALLDAYREFVKAYRAAADRLKQGEFDVQFPEGCFPPRLPFVAPLRPG